VTEPVGAMNRATTTPSEPDAASSPPPARPAQSAPTAPVPNPATHQLVSSHSLLPHPSLECVDSAADAVKGAGGLVVAASTLAASGTAIPVVGFIGASIIFGAVLARYYNCEVEAAQSRAKAGVK